MYINHNQMAGNVSNNLTSHYSNLATSTQRLSSGLRVNSAADDAAGLAIRELMRADIASLDQGVRNANDAISLIQTADGALGIIDEKLIRMKELAEQASTGTYDSTQRLMIESEYQAMASEITRIANATDFNGIKLLNGNLAGTHDGSKMDAQGELKVHFGPGNDSAEDYYYIGIEEMTSQALGLGNASTWQDVQNRGADALKQSLTEQIKNDPKLTDKQRGELMAQVDKAVEQYNTALNNATDYKEAYKFWGAGDTEGFMAEGKEFPGNSSLMSDYMAAADGANTVNGGPTTDAAIKAHFTKTWGTALPDETEITWPTDVTDQAILKAEYWNKVEAAAKEAAAKAGFTAEETDKLINYGSDGTDGLKKKFEDTALAADADIAGMKTALDDAVTAFLGADAGNPGSATNSEVIALRNTGYQQYASDSKVNPAGPTNAAAIVGGLQDAVDEAWAQVDTTKTGSLNINSTADAGQQFKKVLDAVETKAVELGFTAAEAAAVKTYLNGQINNIQSGNTAGSITAGTEADDWALTKTNLKDALAGLNNKAATVTAANAGLGSHANNPLQNKEQFAEAVAIRNQGRANAKANDKLEQFWNDLNDGEKQKLQYAWGKAAMHNLANAETDRAIEGYGIGASSFRFDTALGVDATAGDVNMKDNEMMANALDAANKVVSKADFAGYTIQTQEDAQMALNAINDAITQKDKTRAHLGALQNRLENTVSNLTVQSENLQAAESRISDVDVAKEMTNFVRNQILTQSAVAMLSQANSMPQMAMQLIG